MTEEAPHTMLWVVMIVAIVGIVGMFIIALQPAPANIAGEANALPSGCYQKSVVKDGHTVLYECCDFAGGRTNCDSGVRMN